MEFALVAPLLLIMLLGIVEFGFVFNNYESLRDGVSNAAREGAISVGSFNNATPSCTLTGVSGATNDVEDLMCFAKSRIGVAGTRIRTMFDNPTFSTSGSTYSVGNGIVVCAIYPLSSVTGMFGPLLDHRYVTSESAFQIEQLPTDNHNEVAGSETDPSGRNWSWCQN